MKIALLVTGRTEWHGLATALRCLFPEHHFYTVPTEQEAASYPDQFPCSGFTSTQLTEAHEGAPPESAQELVERAAQEALGDRRARAADLVMVLDDLELANAHQPARVVRVFRRAVECHLAGQQGARERTQQALRQRVSFHLIVPMIEAWFFGDPGALAKAGVPPGKPSPALVMADPEVFETDDAAYAAATEASCPCWMSKGRDKKRRPKWLGDLPRKNHPKAYLQWLCIDGDDRSCTTYDEVDAGKRALAELNWAVILNEPRLRFHYLRALLADLSQALGPPITGQIDEHLSQPVATRLARNASPILRNI